MPTREGIKYILGFYCRKLLQLEECSVIRWKITNINKCWRSKRKSCSGWRFCRRFSSMCRLSVLMILLIPTLVWGNPSGAPPESCATMMPQHGVLGETVSCPFSTVPTQVFRLIVTRTFNWKIFFFTRCPYLGISRRQSLSDQNKTRNLKVGEYAKLSNFNYNLVFNLTVRFLDDCFWWKQPNDWHVWWWCDSTRGQTDYMPRPYWRKIFSNFTTFNSFLQFNFKNLCRLQPRTRMQLIRISLI